MDKKSKVFFVVFFSFILLVVGICFYKFFISKNYYVKADLDCDPQIENCFSYECDHAEDSKCPENPVERISYYKMIQKKAYNIPLCNQGDEDCPPLKCALNEDCEEILCSEDIVGEGEKCAGPDFPFLEENN